MQTAAYWQEKMNTQLASWTELRHDNLLYAKQSYTGGTVCMYPHSYVEPFPEFYSNLKAFGEEASAYFNNINMPYIANYFNRVQGVSDTLKGICEKELAGIPFTPAESSYLNSMIYATGQSGIAYDGWYPNLYYNDPYVGFTGYEGLLESNHIVADIHTTPTDCGGGSLGAISHVGTGNINVGVFITENDLGEPTAFIGPVISYYEYRTMNYLRLNDEEWESNYLFSATRPDWVNIYLADSLGESRGEGSSLVTSVESDDNPIIPESQILLGNYPNPFNPSTLIHFTIPRDLTNSRTTLKIYDVQGSLVKTLVDEVLPAGNYLCKWNATNEAGNKVTSGVYFYSLKVGERVVSKKMILLK